MDSKGLSLLFKPFPETFCFYCQVKVLALSVLKHMQSTKTEQRVVGEELPSLPLMQKNLHPPPEPETEQRQSAESAPVPLSPL